jgi:hypothetical protein
MRRAATGALAASGLLEGAGWTGSVIPSNPYDSCCFQSVYSALHHLFHCVIFFYYLVTKGTQQIISSFIAVNSYSIPHLLLKL